MTGATRQRRQLRHSPYESARFGLRIFRGEIDAGSVGDLCAEMRAGDVDVAILRTRAQAAPIAATLAAAGFPTLVADELVHYSANLQALATQAPADASLRLVPTGKPAQLEAIARSVFADYASHYRANPCFDPERVADGYAEWAVRHAVANDEGRSAWLVESQGDIAGFTCLEVARGEARGVLNGVLPQKRRSGVYRAMMRLTLRKLATEGATRFAISTQSHNEIVQRVWQSEGLGFDFSETTLHVNAFLRRGER